MPNSPPAPDHSDNEPDQLHRLVGKLEGTEEDKRRISDIHDVATDAAAWRPVFEDAGPDRLSFQRKFGVRRDVLLWRLASTYRFETTDPQGLDYLGLFLLTVLLLEEAERRWTPRLPGYRERERQSAQGELRSDERLELRDRLVGDRAVRAALKALYHPGADTKQVGTWEDIDFDSLAFHRLGTTSFILRGKAQVPDTRPSRELALKCVLYPYTKLPPIAEATRTYAARFGMTPTDEHPCRHLVSVWASTDKWIVMDFVEGETLAERIERELNQPPADRGLRLDLLGRLGVPLFDALDELQQELRRKGHGDVAHQDLSPTNVIVAEDQGRFVLKLIDLGRNHLYTRAIGVLEGGDAIYVAPEVKDETPGTHPRADLYSLGQVLIAIGGVGRNEDGTIPDGFYAVTPPLLARFIEDLIDQRPDRRLLLFRTAKAEATQDAEGDDGWSFTQLGRIFQEELGAIGRSAVPLGAPSDRHWLAGLLELLPSSRSPMRLLRLRQERKAQERASLQEGPRSVDRTLRTERERSVFSRWLLAWSWVCATSWWLTALIWGFLIARDLGLDVTPLLGQVVDRALELLAGPQAPSLERLVAANQGPPDFVEHLPERAIGLSFALSGVRYYQNLYAGLTPLLGHRVASLPDRLRGYTAEALMRLQTFWWVGLILVGNLQPRTWPIATAVGLTGVFFMNWACSAFTKRAIRDAQARPTRLSTVPGRHRVVTGLTKFHDWTPSMLFYALFVWPTGWLIYTGTLKDEPVYAAGVVVVNIGLFYIVKCSLSAAEVRAGLARAFLAAERLRHLRAAMAQATR